MYEVTEERMIYIDDLLNSKWEHTNESGCVGQVVFSHLKKARNNSFSLTFFDYLLGLVEKRHKFKSGELYLFVCRSSKYDMGGFSLDRCRWDHLLWTMGQAFYSEKQRAPTWFQGFFDGDEPKIIEEDDGNGGLPFLPFR
jgi:hypothetical protein